MQTIFNFKDEPKFCSGWSTWPSEARPAHISVAPPIGKASYGPGGGEGGGIGTTGVDRRPMSPKNAYNFKYIIIS